MKKIELSGTKVFFTSDLHLGHDGIRNFANRPFGSVAEMDKAIVENWNTVVPDDGLVFVLGDIGFCSAEQLTDLFNRLKGDKILIRGNHDSNFKDSVLQQLFTEIHDILYIRIHDDPDSKFQYIVLCHYPMLDWQSSFRGAWQLFGHLHTRNIPEFANVRTHLLATQYDVGIDNNEFKPVSYTQLKSIIAKQSDNPAFLKTMYYPNNQVS